jgi:LmbE family N-acetylglucosaminyl deacetylase
MSVVDDSGRSPTSLNVLDARATVHLRPHYRRIGKSVFFLISRRPALELSDAEIGLFDAIDGRTNVGVLAARFAHAVTTLRRWAAMEVVEILSAVQIPLRPHLVVIEPHMDDAALSVAGRMLKRRGRERMTILTAIRQSNYTSYIHLKRDYLDVDKVTDLRLQESALAAALVGAEHRCLHAIDAHLRFRPAHQWRLDTLERIHAAAGAYAEAIPSFDFVAELSEALLGECKRLDPDEIWFPLGLGTHIDHRATRSACILMLPELMRHRPGLKFSAYEDLPYAAIENVTYSAKRHADAIVTAFAAQGTSLRCEAEPIDDVVEQKMRAVSVFASQFKRSVMAPKLLQCASMGHPMQLTERFYRFEGTLNLPAESALSPDADFLERAHRVVGDWVRKQTAVRRVVIVLLPNSHLGNWREDKALLFKVFPLASLHLYVPKDCAWEVDDTSGSRVSITLIPDGMAGLLQVMRREMLEFGVPTVLISWGAYGGGSRIKQALLRRAFSMRPVIMMRTLTDVCALLSEQVGLRASR